MKIVAGKNMIFVGEISDQDYDLLFPIGEKVKEAIMTADTSTKPYTYWVEEKYALPFLEKKKEMSEHRDSNKAQ